MQSTPKQSEFVPREPVRPAERAAYGQKFGASDGETPAEAPPQAPLGADEPLRVRGELTFWAPKLKHSLLWAWKAIAVYAVFTLVGSIVFFFTATLGEGLSVEKFVGIASLLSGGFLGVLLGQFLALLRVRAAIVNVLMWVVGYFILVWVAIALAAVSGGYLAFALLGFIFGFPSGLLSLHHSYDLLSSMYPSLCWVGSMFILLNRNGRVNEWNQSKLSVWMPIPLAILAGFIFFLLLFLASKQSMRVELWQALSGSPARRANVQSTVSVLPKRNLLWIAVAALAIFGATAVLSPYLFRSSEGERGEGKGGQHKDGKDGDGKDGQGKKGKGKGKKKGQGKDSQGKDGQGKDGQGKDGQGKDGQGKDGQGKDGQGKDGQGKDGQGKDGQGKDGQGKDGQGKDGQGKDGQGKDGQDQDGQGKDGQGKDGQDQDGQGKDSQGKNAKASGQKSGGKTSGDQNQPGNEGSEDEDGEAGEQPFDQEAMDRATEQMKNAAKRAFYWLLLPLLVLAVLYRPLKRLFTTFYLKHPWLPTTPSEYILYSWEYLRILVEDAGISVSSADAIQETVERVRAQGIPHESLATAGEIYQRARYDLHLLPNDSEEMQRATVAAAAALKTRTSLGQKLAGLWRSLA
jgi:hypothetical protein